MILKVFRWRPAGNSRSSITVSEKGPKAK